VPLEVNERGRSVTRGAGVGNFFSSKSGAERLEQRKSGIYYSLSCGGILKDTSGTRKGLPIISWNWREVKTTVSPPLRKKFKENERYQSRITCPTVEKVVSQTTPQDGVSRSDTHENLFLKGEKIKGCRSPFCKRMNLLGEASGNRSRNKSRGMAYEI